jgi:hypothetical protein
LALLTNTAWAQSDDDEPVAVSNYIIKVVLHNGKRYRGIVGQVTEGTLRIEDNPEMLLFPYSGATLSLSEIKRAVIRPNRRRSARIKGAIAGGLLGLYAGVVHARSNTFRSPALFGVNLALVIGVGAAAGGLTGHLIGNTKRVVIRAVGDDPTTRARQLRVQLEPYSYTHQQDMINRAGQPNNE